MNRPRRRGLPGELPPGHTALHKADPLIKLLLTLFFLLITVSFGKYDLFGLSVLVLFPLLFYQLAELSLRDAWFALRFLLLPVVAVGAVNPFFDRAALLRLGALTVSGGVVSGLTLLLKGLLCLLAGWWLLATTGADDIARALRRLHCPRLPVTVLLLTLRYLEVLVGEAQSMSAAYALRAPDARGVRFHDWGSFLGQLLLRSLDRAQRVYDSMLLRGFSGVLPDFEVRHATRRELAFSLLTAALLLLVRLVDLPALLVGLVMNS